MLSKRLRKRFEKRERLDSAERISVVIEIERLEEELVLFKKMTENVFQSTLDNARRLAGWRTANQKQRLKKTGKRIRLSK